MELNRVSFHLTIGVSKDEFQKITFKMFYRYKLVIRLNVIKVL